MRRTRDLARVVFALSLCLSPVAAGSGAAAVASLEPATIVVGNNVANTIVGVDPSTGAQTLVSSGGSLCTPEGLAVDAGGHLIVASACSNEILRVDPLTGAQTVVSAGGSLSYPSGVAIDADGTIVVANYGTACPPGANSVIRIDPSTGAQTVVSSGGSLVCPTDLALDSHGNIFVSSQIANTVVRIDAASGAQTIVGSGGMLNAPAAIRVDANGKIIVANAGANAILRLDPITGAQTVVSAGGGLNYPSGLDIDAAGNIVVANYHGNSIVRVNPSTGSQTAVSAGGALNLPTRLVIVPQRSLPAVTLTFDDVPGNGQGGFTMTGYGGFNWDGGWGLESDTAYTGPGGNNSYGSPSGEYAAANASGPIGLWRSIESPPGSCCIKEPFDFVGAWFSSYTLNDGLYQNSAVAITVSGYRNGTLVDSREFSLGRGYVWLDADFRGIDHLELRASHSGFGFSARFLMDDFTFRAASVVPPNTAPTASAGGNQVVRPGAVVQLDGSGSYDDNTPTSELQFAWSVIASPEGSTATISGAGNATASFAPDLAGTYIVQLVVTDEAGLSSAPAQATIGGNPPPTADAGLDQLAIVGGPVTLNGAGVDPEGEALTYAWVLTAAPEGSAAGIDNPASDVTTIVPDLPGLYTAQLTVADSVGPGEPNAVQITATTASGYAEIQIQAAGAAIQAVEADAVTNEGNRNSLTRLLSNAVVAMQSGRQASARVHLEQAISRTDGCALRGAPDGSGAGRDWITSCVDQDSIYEALTAALAVAAP